MKKAAILSLAMLMFAFTAAAAEFVGPDRKVGNGNVTFSAGEQHKNLYAAGGNVTVNSDTAGDLFVAGGMITVNGSVEKDLAVGGGNVNLNGEVGDDLRAGGGNVTVNSPVGGDLLIGGGNVNITEKSSVGGDLSIGGGNVAIDSPVNGNVKIGGGSVLINSKITGTVTVMADQDLTFGPKSEVTGKIVYKGPKEAVVKEGAIVSAIEFTKVAPKNVGGKVAALLTIATLIKLLAMFIAALVVNKLFKGTFQTLAEHIYSKPWHNLGIGALVMFATPIAAIILMITVLGFYLGLLLMACYFLILLTASLLLPYFVGSAAVAMYNKTSTLRLGWQELILGLLLVTIVGWIPFIGWLAVCVVFLMCVGEMTHHALQNEHINI